MRCKSKREQRVLWPTWPDHLKIGRISCTDATIKLKVDINSRAKGAFNEHKFVEKGRE